MKAEHVREVVMASPLMGSMAAKDCLTTALLAGYQALDQQPNPTPTPNPDPTPTPTPTPTPNPNPNPNQALDQQQAPARPRKARAGMGVLVIGGMLSMIGGHRWS